MNSADEVKKQKNRHLKLENEACKKRKIKEIVKLSPWAAIFMDLITDLFAHQKTRVKDKYLTQFLGLKLNSSLHLTSRP